MKKSTKGALAAGSAAALLLGGAGSLAYWTATSTQNGGAITAGKLTLTPVSCDNNWVYAPTFAGAGKTVVAFVPGDIVTKSCTFTIGAVGDNLTATIGAPATVDFTPSKTGTSISITNTTTYTVAKGAASRAITNGGTISSATDDGATLTATFVEKIPYGTNETPTTKINANDTQLLTATLNALTVTLTQVNPNLSNP